jgi:hypothetical protein
VTDAERLEAVYDSFNRTGLAAFDEILAERLKWIESPRSVMLTEASRDEVLARMAEMGWQRWHMQPYEFESFGDRVVVSLRETWRSSDVAPPRTERPRAHHWQLVDGRAVRLEVFAAPVHGLIAATGYRALLERLHERLCPRTYVEIGVRTGHTLGRARSGTRLIGIDPNPDLPDPAIEEAFKLFRLTSDDFFARHDLRTELGGLSVDLAFIDGMHLFEFALRDFMNLERHATEQSVIAVHDVYPQGAEYATRERTTLAWSGDVWKLVPCLREHRPDLTIGTVDVMPTGVALISGLDPRSTVLSERYDEIEEQYIGMDYAALGDSRDEQLGRIDHDWAQIERLLAPTHFG